MSALEHKVEIEISIANLLCQASRTDTGELVTGIYMPRPNDPHGRPRHYIVSLGSCVWYEVDPETITHIERGLRNRKSNI